MKNIELQQLLQAQEPQLPLLPLVNRKGFTFRDISIRKVYVITDDQGRPVQIRHEKPESGDYTTAIAME